MKMFNRVLAFLLVVLVLVMLYQINLCLQVKSRYLELNDLKKECDKLSEEIVFYTEIKNSYEFLVEENGKLDVDKGVLQDKVNKIESEINSLKVKIDNLNKKINNLS